MYQGCCMIPSTVMRFFTSASKMRSSRSRHSVDNCIQPAAKMGGGNRRNKVGLQQTIEKWGTAKRICRGCRGCGEGKWKGGISKVSRMVCTPTVLPQAASVGAQTPDALSAPNLQPTLACRSHATFPKLWCSCLHGNILIRSPAVLLRWHRIVVHVEHSNCTRSSKPTQPCWAAHQQTYPSQ